MDGLGGCRLAILKVGEFIGELADVVCDMELGANRVHLLALVVISRVGEHQFVRYLVRISLALRMKFIDRPRPQFEVLIYKSATTSSQKASIRSAPNVPGLE